MIWAASSIHTSPRAAAAPGSASRSARTSSRDWGARSPSTVIPAMAPSSASSWDTRRLRARTDMPGTILLADDEEKILKTLGRALRDEGFVVVTTPSAQEASRLLAERDFD